MERSLFNVCCQLIVQSLVGQEDIGLTVQGDELGDQVTLSVLIRITPEMYSPGINGAVSIRRK